MNWAKYLLLNWKDYYEITIIKIMHQTDWIFILIFPDLLITYVSQLLSCPALQSAAA